MKLHKDDAALLLGFLIFAMGTAFICVHNQYTYISVANAEAENLRSLTISTFQSITLVQESPDYLGKPYVHQNYTQFVTSAKAVQPIVIFYHDSYVPPGGEPNYSVGVDFWYINNGVSVVYRIDVPYNIQQDSFSDVMTGVILFGFVLCVISFIFVWRRWGKEDSSQKSAIEEKNKP